MQNDMLLIIFMYFKNTLSTYACICMFAACFYRYRVCFGVSAFDLYGLEFRIHMVK